MVKKTGVNYKEFTAVEYRYQIVAGENFLIKVNNIVVLLLFEGLCVSLCPDDYICLDNKYYSFFLQVYVGGVDYIHLSVYQNLPCDGGHVVLRGVQQGKKKEDPLDHFPY